MNIDKARIKTLKSSGCSNSFGSFESTYPANLHGTMDDFEFKTTIKNINAKCNTVLSKKYYLLFLISLVGLILVIIGFAKSVNSVNSASGFRMDAPKQDNLNDFSIGFSDDFSEDFNNNNNFDDNDDDDSSPSNFAGGFIFIALGFALMVVGCCIFGISFAVFRNKVLNKIRDELVEVNKHFNARGITWNLESEVVRNYIPSHEYNVHRNNQAYRNSIKYDHEQRPYREETVHYIEIVFPSKHNQIFVPVNFSSMPNIQMNGTTSNMDSGLGFSSKSGNISIEMNSNF
ncbi:hypothetical protein ACTFIW_011593 [Dictyostelium discoideum]